MLRQQIQGTIQLALPLIILYNLFPIILLTTAGQVFCSIIMGMYIYYLNYLQMKNAETILQYNPTENLKDYFNNLIIACGVDPNTITLKYAYANEAIAMATGNIIIIDPVVWHGLQDDTQATKVQEIFHAHIESNLSSSAKERLKAIHDLLNPAIQRFIFKHELGHIVYNFSYKKLIIIFFIGLLATYTGIISAIALLQIHPLLSIFVGMFVGTGMDLFLTYISNIVWKLQQEKMADAFAVEHSNDEDVHAAANFFKEHQKVRNTYQDATTILPEIIISGHQNGFNRSTLLLKLLTKK